MSTHGIEMTSDRDGQTEGGLTVYAGTRVEYLGHVTGGMVKVRFGSNGIVDVMHPACFSELRTAPS